MEKLAVIKIRSDLGKNNKIKEALRILGLRKLYSCVVINKSPKNLGIIRNAESVITYGEIDDKTMKTLLIKRGKISNKKKISASEQEISDFLVHFLNGEKKLAEIGVKNTFNLHPPRKGFERKGKKAPFSLKGAFGYRGKDINDLIQRMV